MSELESYLRRHNKTQQELAAELGLAQSSIARAVAGDAGKAVAFAIADHTGLNAVPMMRRDSRSKTKGTIGTTPSGETSPEASFGCEGTDE